MTDPDNTAQMPEDNSALPVAWGVFNRERLISCFKKRADADQDLHEWKINGKDHYDVRLLYSAPFVFHSPAALTPAPVPHPDNSLQKAALDDLEWLLNAAMSGKKQRHEHIADAGHRITVALKVGLAPVPQAVDVEALAVLKDWAFFEHALRAAAFDPGSITLGELLDRTKATVARALRVADPEKVDQGAAGVGPTAKEILGGGQEWFPCGCVSYVCGDITQCHGCGAKSCGNKLTCQFVSSTPQPDSTAGAPTPRFGEWGDTGTSAVPTPHPDAAALAELLIRYTDNESTAYPVWGIVSNAGLGKIAWHSGPWFNREDAEDHLKNKAHRYPKSAKVYCFSGTMSWHYREIVDAARELLRAKGGAV